MRLNTINDLRPAREQAIIINVGTRLATTLALVSALKYARMPVLLVDCESKDDSPEYFSDLLNSYDFDLLSAPLRRHGETLDWLFRSISCDKMILVDSDVEILNDEPLAFMRSYIDDRRTFACGFIDGPGWLVGEQGFLHNAYFVERPWMPLVAFRADKVREALDAGCSFADKVVFNDNVSGGLLTKVMRRARQSLPSLSRFGIRVPSVLRTSFNGWNPEIVFYDTGADIYQYLRFRKEYLFVGIPAHFHERWATHFFGVSRHALGKGGTSLESVADTIAERLRSKYGISATSPSNRRHQSGGGL